MLASDLLLQMLAHATLAGATAHALNHRVSVHRRAFADGCKARAVESSAAGWVAPLTALVYGLSIRGDDVLLIARALRLMVPALALNHTRAQHAAKATKATATDGNHE